MRLVHALLLTPALLVACDDTTTTSSADERTDTPTDETPSASEPDGDDAEPADEDPHESDTEDTDSESEPAPDPIAIAGTWTDTFDGHHVIDSATWDQGWAFFEIEAFDNEAQVAIAALPVLGGEPVWNRFDWTEADGAFWYCQTVYDAESFDEANEAPRADDTSPSAGGCGPFPWTQLIPADD